MTFLEATYYPWTSLAAMKPRHGPELETLVCLNLFIYVTEGFRAAMTTPGTCPFKSSTRSCCHSALFFWLSDALGSASV